MGAHRCTLLSNIQSMARGSVCCWWAALTVAQWVRSHRLLLAGIALVACGDNTRSAHLHVAMKAYRQVPVLEEAGADQTRRIAVWR